MLNIWLKAINKTMAICSKCMPINLLPVYLLDLNL